MLLSYTQQKLMQPTWFPSESNSTQFASVCHTGVGVWCACGCVQAGVWVCAYVDSVSRSGVHAYFASTITWCSAAFTFGIIASSDITLEMSC